MLGRSIARVARPSHPYVCLSCRTQQLVIHRQSLLYSTSTQSHKSGNGGLHAALAGKKSPYGDGLGGLTRANGGDEGSASVERSGTRGKRRAKNKVSGSEVTDRVKSPAGVKESEMKRRQKQSEKDRTETKEASNKPTARERAAKKEAGKGQSGNMKAVKEEAPKKSAVKEAEKRELVKRVIDRETSSEAMMEGVLDNEAVKRAEEREVMMMQVLERQAAKEAAKTERENKQAKKKKAAKEAAKAERDEGAAKKKAEEKENTIKASPKRVGKFEHAKEGSHLQQPRLDTQQNASSELNAPEEASSKSKRQREISSNSSTATNTSAEPKDQQNATKTSIGRRYTTFEAAEKQPLVQKYTRTYPFSARRVLSTPRKATRSSAIPKFRSSIPQRIPTHLRTRMFPPDIRKEISASPSSTLRRVLSISKFRSSTIRRRTPISKFRTSTFHRVSITSKFRSSMLSRITNRSRIPEESLPLSLKAQEPLPSQFVSLQSLAPSKRQEVSSMLISGDLHSVSRTLRSTDRRASRIISTNEVRLVPDTLRMRSRPDSTERPSGHRNDRSHKMRRENTITSMMKSDGSRNMRRANTITSMMKSDTSIQDAGGFSSLKEAMSSRAGVRRGPMDIKRLSADDLHFIPVDVQIPPVPTLAHGLDRVLFNPGVYHLQDPRSRVYNFDPYLEKIMPATEFDFEALGKYMTSSKDNSLINMAKSLEAKFTGSTSSMSGVLTHFHYLLSQWRPLNFGMLSQDFPTAAQQFSKIQRAPAAIFLRWKDGTYAIDADKEFDTPNIMSWLGQSMEKLLTNSVDQFERYRRGSSEKAPEDDDDKCFHYTQQGSVLMRSQLDAKDPRLPGTGIFDLKTRAVVSVRMDSSEFEHHSGYQIKQLRGEWESFEREYYDMIRATMLKYSLQVRMGRMDGIFIAYHNVERIFGFQYVSKPEMDLALHGQEDTCLGDQEFKLSVELLSEILEKAAAKFPEQSIRLHFETRNVEVPFMYIFAEPVSEEQVEAIQTKNQAMVEEFERSVVGLGKQEEESMQKEWSDINSRVEAELQEDQEGDVDIDDEEGIITIKEEAGSKKNEALEEVEDDDTTTPATELEVEEDSITDDAAEEEENDALPESVTASDATAPIEETPPTEQAPQSEDTDAQGMVDALETSLPEPTDNILGFTLTIRNRVNNIYVERPSNLAQYDDWAIEYSLSEIPSENRRVSRLYEQVKARRQKLLVFERPEEGAVDYYRKMLSDFSKNGRVWREKMDKRDSEKGTHVYTPLGMDREDIVAKMGPWGRNGGVRESAPEQKVEAEVDDVEDYMEWLYANMGNGKV